MNLVIFVFVSCLFSFYVFSLLLNVAYLNFWFVLWTFYTYYCTTLVVSLLIFSSYII